MKKLLLLSLGLSFVFASCKKEVFDHVNSTTKPVTTQNGGMKVTMKTTTGSSTSVSAGVGFACGEIDSITGNISTAYGIATGNSVIYDPTTKSIYSTDPNEHPLFIGWGDNVVLGPSVGTFTGAFVAGEFNGKPVYSDGTGVTINVTSFTTDSLFGDFFGPIEETIMTIDTINNIPIFTPTGVFDTISGVFAVERAPCY